MRGILLIGMLIAIAVVAYLQLNAMDLATGGSGETAAESAKRQAEQIERELQKAADEQRKRLEEATR